MYLCCRPAPGRVRSGFQNGTRVVHGSDHFYQRGDVSDMLKWREDGGLQIVYWLCYIVDIWVMRNCIDSIIGQMK